MAPPYRPSGAPGRDRQAGFPWLVKAMMAVMVMAVFVVLLMVWSQAGAPSQLRAAPGDDMGPRPQDGVTALSE